MFHVLLVQNRKIGEIMLSKLSDNCRSPVISYVAGLSKGYFPFIRDNEY